MDRLFKFQKNIIISGNIKCKTGMHIGGSKEELQIGGVESPVIIDPRTGAPVIPGSSLKGKIRSLLELEMANYSSDGTPHDHKKEEACRNPDCPVCIIFGSSGEGMEKNIKEAYKYRGPTRLIIRDSIMTADDNLEMEVKAENVINRLTGKAEHPRFTERVPAGSNFNFEMVFTIYHNEDISRLKVLLNGLNKLQDNYIGGSGSRGYGKIIFGNLNFIARSADDYLSGNVVKTPIKLNGKDTFSPEEILQNFGLLETELMTK
jgi:CRISPR-associated protein Csm3